MQNLTVTFDTHLYANGKGFQFPEPVARTLGWRKGQPFSVTLLITKRSGEPAFCGVVPCISGTEILTAEVFRQLKQGQEIRVIAAAWQD